MPMQKNKNKNKATTQNKTDTAQKQMKQARGQNNMEASKELNTAQTRSKSQNKR